MNLLEQLLSGLPPTTDWARQQMEFMNNNTPVPPELQEAMNARAVAPLRPAPAASPSPAAPPVSAPPARMPTGGAPQLAGPSAATYLSGALSGASQASNPIGAILGAVGGAMGAGNAVDQRNQTYQLLVSKGMDPNSAALAVRDPNAMKMALGQIFTKGMTPEQRAMVQAELRLKNAQADQLERKVQTPPLSLTKAEEAVDKAFAKDYTEFVAGGGFADAQKNLDQLRQVRAALADPNRKNSLTGPVTGPLSQTWLGPLMVPKAVNMREKVEEVVQRNLRVVLGAQFTEREGERLIARAFNAGLEEKDNAERLDRLIGAMDQMLKAKQEAAQYYERFGTLKGFKGSSMLNPRSADDVLKIAGIEAAPKAPASQPQGLPPGWSYNGTGAPSQATRRQFGIEDES